MKYTTGKPKSTIDGLKNQHGNSFGGSGGAAGNPSHELSADALQGEKEMENVREKGKDPEYGLCANTCRLSSSGMGDWREQSKVRAWKKSKESLRKPWVLNRKEPTRLSKMATDGHTVMKRQNTQDGDKIPNAIERKVTQMIYNQLELDQISSTRFMKKQSGFGVPGLLKNRKRIPEI